MSADNAFVCKQLQPMRMMSSRRCIFWCLIGGCAFWLPMIVTYAVLRDRSSLVALNVAPLVGLQLLDIVCRIRDKDSPQWRWVLAGIYLLGPLAMEIASLTVDYPHHMDWLWFVVFALLPPMTLWFATLWGIIISVLIATVLLGLFADHESRTAARE